MRLPLKFLQTQSMLKNPPPPTSAQIQGHEARPPVPKANCPDCGKPCKIERGFARCSGIKDGSITHGYGLTFEAVDPLFSWRNIP